MSVVAKIVIDQGKLADGLLAFQKRFEDAMNMFCDTSCRKLQAGAQRDRKWTDRTGHARQRLTSTYEKTGTGYRLELAHGVDYGIWLELANEKRYAIIMPTIDKVGQGEIMPAFNNFISKLGG